MISSNRAVGISGLILGTRGIVDTFARDLPSPRTLIIRITLINRDSRNTMGARGNRQWRMARVARFDCWSPKTMR